MNVCAASSFWAQRPRLTARGLELACWLSAIAFLAALLEMPTSAAAGPPSHGAAVRDFVAQDVAQPTEPWYPTTFVQVRCIKRVVVLTQTWPSLDIGKQIERQCLIPRVRPGGYGKRRATATACMPTVTWRLPLVPRRPAGCP